MAQAARPEYSFSSDDSPPSLLISCWNRPHPATFQDLAGRVEEVLNARLNPRSAAPAPEGDSASNKGSGSVQSGSYPPLGQRGAGGRPDTAVQLRERYSTLLSLNGARSRMHLTQPSYSPHYSRV